MHEKKKKKTKEKINNKGKKNPGIYEKKLQFIKRLK